MSNCLTPIKAIRAKCLECSGNQPSEVRACLIFECALFNYRLGKNPNRKGIGGSKRPLEQDNSTQVEESCSKTTK